ncbi:hypothetical protein LCGC14_1873170 [marine sediment metagenome]|uniref:Uncharacterized protein n=1 Tax=marine sediment metagenome TaxID=412755 RepID=A0A0F9G4J1_9ZZZZ
MTADLRSADVYISIFGRDPILQKDGKTKTSKDDAAQNRTFEAITHAKNRIQSLVAGKLQSKFCPVLCFRRDEEFKTEPLSPMPTMILTEKEHIMAGEISVLTGYEKDELISNIENATNIEDIKKAFLMLLEYLPNSGY